MKNVWGRTVLFIYLLAFMAPTEKELLQSILEQLLLIKQELLLFREKLQIIEEQEKMLSSLREEVRSLRSELDALKKQIAPANTQQPDTAKTLPSAQVEVSIEGSPYFGSADAPVVIVEFTDYQCPFCGRHFRETLPLIRREYVEKGKVKYVLKDYPLDFHPQAKPTALAARCAGAQGKYWEMHDALFARQAMLGPVLFQQLARELQLNPEEFQECLTSGTFEKAVASDIASAQQAGIRGTPSFIIGKPTITGKVAGTILVGAVPFEKFQEILDALLSTSNRE
ncbi:MAG: DsbA family protein [bacterium]